jgi:hypothetical protein
MYALAEKRSPEASAVLRRRARARSRCRVARSPEVVRRGPSRPHFRRASRVRSSMASSCTRRRRKARERERGFVERTACALRGVVGPRAWHGTPRAVTTRQGGRRRQRALVPHPFARFAREGDLSSTHPTRPSPAERERGSHVDNRERVGVRANATRRRSSANSRTAQGTTLVLLRVGLEFLHSRACLLDEGPKPSRALSSTLPPTKASS